MEPKQCCGALGFRHKKGCPGLPNEPMPEQTKVAEPVSQPVETGTTSKEEELLKQIEELKSRDAETQKKLEMLYAVADKGRLFNYENQKKEKAPLRVKLSKWNGGTIVGWRTVKDEIVLDPRTGSISGEFQQYEVLLLGPDGKTTTHTITGYENFSNARYNERIECEVVSRREDFDGKITFELSLPNGEQISLGSQFIN